MPTHSESFSTEASGSDWDCEGLRSRLAECVGNDTVSAVAQKTGFNSETTRRYLRTGKVPARFIRSICTSYDVDPRWLILGGRASGPGRMCRISDLTVPELLLELASRIKDRDSSGGISDVPTKISARTPGDLQIETKAGPAPTGDRRFPASGGVQEQSGQRFG